MKKKFCLLLFVCLVSFFMAGCLDAEEIVRIHIRANSNSEIDQNVKLKVRDGIIEYITPLLASCENSKEVKNILKLNLKNIESVANDVLYYNGFSYVSNAKISNEYFPTREYGEVVYPADYYDALIIELGSGTGDNWWCVAYPPLCFVGEGSGDIEYRSKLVEMISKFFGD